MSNTFNLLLILLLPVFCQAQDRKLEKWDSAYLQHYVDSTGTIPSGVDLRTLHLETAINFIDPVTFDTIPLFLGTGIVHEQDETRRDTFYIDPAFLDSLYNIEDSLLELLNECRTGKMKASYIRGNKYREYAKKAFELLNSTPIKKPE